MSDQPAIIFEQKGLAGVITLNKPETLNAVTDDMLTALNAKLDEWQADSSIERIVIRAVEGRAFSAGGDIRHLYECGMAQNYDFDFFVREYVLNARIATFPKPYIALIDGIVMGGGVGVSFHGSHRVAGDNIAFAMPEVGIGFFPDVGGSYLLSRLPGKLGLYLGMTGNRMKQADAVHSGLATHACKSDRFAALEEAMCSEKDLEDLLQRRTHKPTDAPYLNDVDKINAAFFAASPLAIVENLQEMAVGDDPEYAIWAAKTLQTLLQKSPFSLEVAFKQITRAEGLSIHDCMRMEYRILKRVLPGYDFYEGIRAAIIDKDQAPKWDPLQLKDVDLDKVEACFAPLLGEELPLPEMNS